MSNLTGELRHLFPKWLYNSPIKLTVNINSQNLSNPPWTFIIDMLCLCKNLGLNVDHSMVCTTQGLLNTQMSFNNWNVKGTVVQSQYRHQSETQQKLQCISILKNAELKSSNWLMYCLHSHSIQEPTEVENTPVVVMRWAGRQGGATV